MKKEIKNRWFLIIIHQRVNHLAMLRAVSYTHLDVYKRQIDAIAAQVGFQSATSLRQHFKHRLDVTPSEWRKTFQGKHMAIAN